MGFAEDPINPDPNPNQVACENKAIGAICNVSNDQGTCQAAENNCDVAPVNGKCVVCVITPPQPQPKPNPTTRDKLTPNNPASSFCLTKDGSIGQWHRNWNNCGGDLGPCRYCAVPMCDASSVGKSCGSLELEDAICTKNETRCPVGGTTPCYICANNNAEFQEPDADGCLSSTVHQPTTPTPWGLAVLFLGLFAWRVRRRF